jgi:hypothetical protein
MSLKFYDQQKSPKRRFLLILGVVTFICVFAIGIMVMFWDKLDLGLSHTQRLLFGGLFLLYGVLRFSRIFKKQPDDE